MRLSLDVPVSLDGWWGPASLVAWAIAQTLAPLTLRFAFAGFYISWSRFGKLLGAHLNLHPASPSLPWFSAMNFLSVGKGKGRSGIEPSRASESSTSLTPANSRAGQDQPERRHGAIEEELLSTADEIIGSCDRSVYTHLFIRSCSNAATPGFAF